MQNSIDLLDIMSILPGHVYWKDLNGVYLGCNDAQAKTLNCKDKNDVIGKTDYDLHPKEVADVFTKNDQNIIFTGQSKTIEEYSYNEEGRLSVYLSKKVPLKNKKNKTIGIIGISFDITEEKERQKRKEFILDKIISMMPGHVYWQDLDCNYLGCNEQQAKSAGLSSRDQIIGKKNKDLPWNYSMGMLPEKLDSINREVMRTGTTITIEEPGNSPDETEATFLSTKAPLKDEHEKIVGMVGISVNITDKIKAQQLEKDKALEQERAETMKLMAAGIAHELRTPLRAISTGLECIKYHLDTLMEVYKKAEEADLDIPILSKADQNEVYTVLDNSQSETESSFNIIDMLLTKVDLSRINEEEFEVISINDCVGEALSRYAFDIDERALVHWDNASGFDFKGDKLLVIHIFFNLLKNAIHFIRVAQKGEIRIWNETTPTSNYLHFKDTGLGIAPDILPRIFDRFFSKTKHGTGIGLAFCKMVMQNFGGDILCNTEPGKFTEFVLHFPKANLTQNCS